MITKFNFNSLFSKAWLSAVTPANMIAGFKTCGVYPFNSSAIGVSMDTDSHDSVNSNPSAESGNNGSRCRGTTVITGSKPAEFTDEQEQLLITRSDMMRDTT